MYRGRLADCFACGVNRPDITPRSLRLWVVVYEMRYRGGIYQLRISLELLANWFYIVGLLLGHLQRDSSLTVRPFLDSRTTLV